MFNCGCGSRNCYQADGAHVEVHVRVGEDMSKMTRVRGRIVVCAGCGRLDIFADDPASWGRWASATLVGPESTGQYR